MIISHVAHRWRAKLYEPGWFPWLVGGIFLDKRWLMGDDFHPTQVWLAYPVWLQLRWRKVIVVLSERKVWFWWWGAGVSSRGGSMAAWILLQNTSDHTLRLSVWTSSGLLECASKCNSQYLETFPPAIRWTVLQLSWQTIFIAIFCGGELFSGFGRAEGWCSLKTFPAENVRGTTVACECQSRSVHNLARPSLI